MRITRIRVVYISSLVILVALVVFIAFQSIGNIDEYTEVQQEQILETGSDWIIQLNIINNEGEKQNYTINILNGDKTHTEKISVNDRNVFAYMYRIQRDTLTSNEVEVIIYQDGKDKPIEQLTYHLKQ